MYKKTISELNVNFKRDELDSGYASLFKSELKSYQSSQFDSFHELNKNLVDKRIKYFANRLVLRVIMLPYFLVLFYMLINNDYYDNRDVLTTTFFSLIPFGYYGYLKVVEKKYKNALTSFLGKHQAPSEYNIKNTQIDSAWYPTQELHEVGKKAMDNFILSFKVSAFEYNGISKIKDLDISIGVATICLLVALIYIDYRDGLETSIYAFIQYIGYFCGWLGFSIAAFPFTDKFSLLVRQNQIISDYCDFRDMYLHFIGDDVDGYDKRMIDELAKTRLYKNMDSFYLRYLNAP